MKMKNEILVVRDHDVFSSILSENGFSVVNFPAIKIEKITDFSELDEIVSEIEIFDGIFVTSPNAAAPFLERLREKNKTYSGKIYVLGKRAHDLFKSAQIETIFDENINNAAELLNSISKNELQGKKILCLRGNLSSRLIPETLKKFAEIRELTVYQTAAAQANEKQSDKIRKKLQTGKLAAACFFSPSAAKIFIEQFGAEFLHQTIIATIGTTTAEYFEMQNLAVDFISR